MSFEISPPSKKELAFESALCVAIMVRAGAHGLEK